MLRSRTLILAQLVQLLYNVVDRIYIGLSARSGQHGADGDRSGCSPLTDADRGLYVSVWARAARRFFLCEGAGKEERAGKNTGQYVFRFCLPHRVVLFCSVICFAAGALSVRRQRRFLSVCGRLPADLSDRELLLTMLATGRTALSCAGFPRIGI